MRTVCLLGLAAFLSLSGATGGQGKHGPESAMKLTLIPAPQASDPWVAVTPKTVGEMLGDGNSVPRMRLRLEGVTVTRADNVALLVFANTLTVLEKGADQHPALVYRGFPFPADSKEHAFELDLADHIGAALKAGKLRRDRPLVLAIRLAPAASERKFDPGDWSISRVSLKAGEE